MAKQEGKGKGVLSRIAESLKGEFEEGQKATDMLKEQHDEVRRLFKEYEGAGEGAHAARKRLIDQACRDLEVHSTLEERIFYPACRELEDEDARKMVGESIEEHLIVKRLIKELGGLSGSDETFESKATVLKESVEHHADEEESDLFPVAEKEMGDDRLLELGEEMRRLKERLSAGPTTRRRTATRGTSRSTGARR